ncbi:proliferating cell nuclear antigen 2, putative [Plasmodium vinckei]|uniref:DNA sliding clamp PCNA n=7 Tax=Plasmodium (Vinckeia) TaxID=418101 RepID=W7B8T4_PLAVN|nr:proliferating cell nuclear antigen 2, putative [Plasmodium vinckei vinckei]XP_743255.1 proliferating cell nuclear antigen 2, putative [Plasmodium chabaudi chabaudi]EUD74491.1 proliferating cell nuclear antigen (pcna) [Plasmodium vinckei petteri]CAD2105108.1 proliferating cell nuclear antigen 2, putative [Plasmodium vinckei lentum]CAD2105260.1 proliferating cell nuclear antigen 2, putative [Plasmodium vinckei brucechwatti]CAD2113976.1 proliferating cell nuclear antigen 2, putative [Plasmodiu|eukprot:XP_743255.1 proliferating cell nuclear antigen 2, putative [Plasmodium chabaudi chabaudi]
MFECRIDGQFFKKLFETLKDICTEVNLECDENGIKMQSMDCSHVSLVDLNIMSDFFQHYRCDKKCVLGISINFMLKILSVIKEKSTVFLFKEDNENDAVLNIGIIDEEEQSSTEDSLEIQVKLINTQKEHLEIPQSEYHCQCTMKSKKFQEFTKYLNSIGDNVSISMKKDTMILSTTGSDIKVTKQFTNDMADISITCSKYVSQEFATRYLVMFSRASALSDEVLISLSPNIPVSIKFNFKQQLTELPDNSHLTFFLAPKIGEY